MLKDVHSWRLQIKYLMVQELSQWKHKNPVIVGSKLYINNAHVDLIAVSTQWLVHDSMMLV